MGMATIVVIEDNLQTARMVGKLLRARGHIVYTIQTGEEGFLKIMADVPNLILVDLGLPDIDGQTVIAIIRQQPVLEGIPIIAFTAWPPATARQMAKAYGCDGVITKPIDTQTFAQQIESFLCHAAPLIEKSEPGSGTPAAN